MPLYARSCALLVAAVLFSMYPAAATAARQGAVRGQVTDSSGGVLPGVTVQATAPNGRVIATAITDGVGRFSIPNLPDGRVAIVFQLDGFDPTRVEVVVYPGADLQVVERMNLAQVTENVIVYGKVPEPPPLPRVEIKRRVPPTLIPIALEELESI